MDDELTQAVWTRLLLGKPLDGIGLAKVDGRLDLRGISSPTPHLGKQRPLGSVIVTTLGGLSEIRGVRWKNLDFSNGVLTSLRFHNAEIENCVFDQSECKDWRVWGTTFADTKFRSANLQSSALGAVEGSRRNDFINIDFSSADLRQSAYESANFISCRFSGTKLTNVDFGGSTFVDCAFEGEMEGVVFNRQAFSARQGPINEMKNVDFSKAHFRFVEYHLLDVATVKWPEDGRHVVIRDYRKTLERLVDQLTPLPDLRSRKLAAVLTSRLRWAGPRQEMGVISQEDLIEIGGETLVQDFMQLVGGQSRNGTNAG